MSAKKWGKGQLWTPEELDKLRSFYTHASVKELAEELGRSQRSIRAQAIRLGFRRRHWIRFSPRQLGNPYDYLTVAEKGYIAGLLDGEGTISLFKVGGKTYPRVTIVNTYGPVIKWLQDKLGGRVRPRALRKRATKPLYTWDLTGTAKCQYLLDALLPYLLIKREKAEQALALKAPRLGAISPADGRSLPG